MIGNGAAFRVPPESDGRVEEEKTKDRKLRLLRICPAFTLLKEACCVKGFPANSQLSGWDLPGGPVHKSLCDHHRGPEFDCGLASKDPACHAAWPQKIQAKGSEDTEHAPRHLHVGCNSQPHTPF